MAIFWQSNYSLLCTFSVTILFQKCSSRTQVYFDVFFPSFFSRPENVMCNNEISVISSVILADSLTSTCQSIVGFSLSTFLSNATLRVTRSISWWNHNNIVYVTHGQNLDDRPEQKIAKRLFVRFLKIVLHQCVWITLCTVPTNASYR